MDGGRRRRKVCRLLFAPHHHIITYHHHHGRIHLPFIECLKLPLPSRGGGRKFLLIMLSYDIGRPKHKHMLCTGLFASCCHAGDRGEERMDQRGGEDQEKSPTGFPSHYTTTLLTYLLLLLLLLLLSSESWNE